MDRNKVINLLKKGSKTTEDIAKKMNADIKKLRVFLMRLMEEGKISRKQVTGKWRWYLPELDKEQKKLDRLRQYT